MAEVMRKASSIKDFVDLMVDWSHKMSDAMDHDDSCCLEVAMENMDTASTHYFVEMVKAVMPRHISEIRVDCEQTFLPQYSSRQVLRVSYKLEG